MICHPGSRGSRHALHARVAHPFGRTVHIVFEWQLDPPPVLRQSFSDGFENGMSG